MLYNMENIKTAIKTALFNNILANNPRLAKAIAYRSRYPHLFSIGDLASFYDSNGTYKTELQTCSASINVVLDEPVTNIKTVKAEPVTITLNVTNTPTYEDVYNSYTYTYGWEITIVYKDGSEQTYTITIKNLFDFYI